MHFAFFRNPCAVEFYVTMGDHVLVKWTTEDKWDVYPLRNIKSQEVICQLLDDPRSIKALATEEVEVLWADNKYAPAYVLAMGSQVAMERRRTRLVAGQLPQSSLAGRKRKCSCGLEDEVDCLKEELEISRAKVQELADKLDVASAKASRLKAKYADAKQLLDLEKMAKNLKKATQELTGAMSVASSAPATLPVCKLDIGDGVLVEKQLVDRISLSAKHQPSKFARALLRVVFSPEELENSSLYGKVCRANKDAAPKKALDQKRVEAVVSYTCSLYNVGVKEVKGSLSAMLARGQVH
ncbi:BEN domain-containing protein 5-like [Dermacentor albipictus]|uniref:BEN domain-containing protein 5-like n=1 Tax=Dermacentor albipictus TaxID=60249 RepID=UPI0038FC5BCF